MKKETDKVLYTTKYALTRCNNKSLCYGHSHGSQDAEKTSCGIDINDKWIITHNRYDGKISCPKCLKKIKSTVNDVI